MPDLLGCIYLTGDAETYEGALILDEEMRERASRMGYPYIVDSHITYRAPEDGYTIVHIFGRAPEEGAA